MQIKEVRFIDLFGGIGGFHYGLTQASSSFKCVWANEWDKYASSVYRARFPETTVDTRDIRTVSPEEVPQHDLLCGGFPCQAFSVAGRREGFDDIRGTLFREIVRIAEHHRPQLLLLENVKGLLNHDKGHTFRIILEELGHIGYRCEWQVLNTKWFGVPQNRERIFIVGHLGKGSSRAVFPFIDIGETAIGQLEEWGEVAHAIDGNYFKGVDNHAQRTVIASDEVKAISSTNPKEPNVKKQYHMQDEVRTIPASNAGNNNPLIIQPVLTPNRLKKTQNGERIKEDGEDSFTLTAQEPQGIMIVADRTRTKAGLGRNLETPKEISNNLTGVAKDNLVMLHNIYGGFGEDKPRVSIENSPTIRTPAGGGHLPLVADAEAVGDVERRIRRLTPIECERLQAFPDNWTATGIVDGKEVRISDTQRYKMCGNAVTTRVVTYIGKRLIYGLESVIPVTPEPVDDWFG
jgi:DNA (cytosine-5)-methyltransferase 1